MPALSGMDYTIVQALGTGRFNLVERKTGRVVVSMVLRSVQVNFTPDDVASAQASFIVMEGSGK